MLTFFTCEKEEDFESQEPIKTVTVAEIKEALNSKNNSLRTTGNDTYVTAHLDSITQEEITNSNELMTVIEAETIYPAHYSRILLLKINDTIQSTVFSMYKKQDTTTTSFTGELIITKLDGSFINGFRIEDGIAITQFTKKGKNDTSSARTTNSATCPDHGACTIGSSCILCEQMLDEIVITNTNSSGGGSFSISTIFFDQNDDIGYSDYEWQYENGTPAGGGNDSGACTGGKVKDAAGNCNCPDGKAEDANGNCIDSCPIVSGYIHTSAFSGTVVAGDNTITNQDNFRNHLGGINVAVNCTGKIKIGDVVNVINATPETRMYVKSDGTTGTSTYYKVTYQNCDGNNKKNPAYDPNKPCSDCDKGNPLKMPKVAAQLGGSGIKGGMYGKTRNSETKWHYGVDLENEYGEPIYAMFDGIASQGSQSSGAGFFVVITSTINGETIKSLYFHMQENNRVIGNVKAGDIIGYQGDSGNLKNAINDGYAVSHLHIKIKKNGIVVNPENYMKTTFDDTTGDATHPDDCN